MPAFREADGAEVVAIASRDGSRAEAVAADLSIPRAFGSYEALLADPDIDAVYIPLPNHLHEPWTVRSLEAGKHVLCEKPLGMSATEARSVQAVAGATGRLAVEGFMYRFHPQWQIVDELIAQGRIGELRLVAAWFSYPPNDRSNVRYVREWGGGALLDIGCYCINVVRRLFGGEPVSTRGAVARDLESGVDVLTSAVLDFGRGHAIISCGIEHDFFQQVTVTGTEGSIVVTMPFNPRPDTEHDIVLRTGHGQVIDVIQAPAANQFALQIDAMSTAIRTGSEGPLPLADSVANMEVIDALFAGG